MNTAKVPHTGLEHAAPANLSLASEHDGHRQSHTEFDAAQHRAAPYGPSPDGDGPAPPEDLGKLLSELSDTLAAGLRQPTPSEPDSRDMTETPTVTIDPRYSEDLEQFEHFDVRRRADVGQTADTANLQAVARLPRHGRLRAWIGARRERHGDDGRRGLLCGIVLLALSLGLLPFAPSLFDLASAQKPPRSSIAHAQHAAAASTAALTMPAVAGARMSKARIEIAAARVVRGRPGDTVAFPITAGDLPREHPGAFIVLREFPAGATFSRGQSLGLGLWTLPADDLADLRIHLPHEMPDVSLMTLEVIDANGDFLAQTASALAVEPGFATVMAPANPNHRDTNAPRQVHASRWPPRPVFDPKARVHDASLHDAGLHHGGLHDGSLHDGGLMLSAQSAIAQAAAPIVWTALAARPALPPTKAAVGAQVVHASAVTALAAQDGARIPRETTSITSGPLDVPPGDHAPAPRAGPEQPVKQEVRRRKPVKAGDDLADPAPARPTIKAHARAEGGEPARSKTGLGGPVPRRKPPTEQGPDVARPAGPKAPGQGALMDVGKGI